MNRRMRLKLLARKAAGYACAAAWIVSHNARGAWQVRAMFFEGLLIRYQLPGSEWASVEVFEMDQQFHSIFSEVRRKYGRAVVRESQTHTSAPLGADLRNTTIH